MFIVALPIASDEAPEQGRAEQIHGGAGARSSVWARGCEVPGWRTCVVETSSQHGESVILSWRRARATGAITCLKTSSGFGTAGRWKANALWFAAFTGLAVCHYAGQESVVRANRRP